MRYICRSMSIDFKVVLVFCLAQISILIVVLFMKRFRNFVNLFLGAIFFVILLKFTYYLIYFYGIFDTNVYQIHLIRFLQAMPPPLLWFYASAILSGSIILRKRMWLHALPLGIAFLFYVPLIVKSIAPDLISGTMESYNRWFGLVFAEAGGVLFVVYSQLIFRSLYKLYGANRSIVGCMLDITHPHLTLLKVLSIMMNVYALILFSGGFIAFFAESTPTLFDYLDTGFLILLSYLMIFILISIPKVIHYKYSRLSDTDRLLKYEKSSLSKSEALKYMQEMNKWMESEKAYLDSNISLADLTEKLNLPGYVISEVLNGLLKQNFYDYINNYRIEEFKRLAHLPEHSNETNLGLAFISGFSSKTTFNTAFKKFTRQTPSEFRAGITKAVSS